MTLNPTRWGLLLGVLMVFLGLVWWLTGENEVTAVERTPPVQPVAERLEASSLPEARETRELVAPPIAEPPVAEQSRRPGGSSTRWIPNGRCAV